jgi:competence protein ComEC
MIAFHKGEIPFTLLLLPFLAGLWLDIIYPCSTYIHLLQIAFCFIILAFIALNLGYQHLHLYKAKWIGGLMAGSVLLLAGMICFEANREINSTTHFSKYTSKYLTGIITNEPKLSNGILRFTVKIEKGGDTNQVKAMTGNLLVALKTDTSHQINLSYGDEILLPGKFDVVEPPLNPAEFNYKAYLAHQNIYQQFFLIQHQVAILHHDRGNAIVANALKLRLQLVNKLKSNIHDTDAVAVASTIILGYRADLRKEVQETYAKTGTMHLLSVAGMHVGLVYLMIAFVLSFLPHRKHTKLIKALISITLIWCYALITGFSPAVSRAALMLTMVIIGLTYNRHINKLNVLAVSAFILLLYNPFYITDAGFQLSYLAVFGIIIIQPYIYKWFSFQSRFAREVWLVCSVSIAAQIILFPIAALYFHDFPVYFLASNVFIIIPSAIVMYAGILYLALPNIPVISAALGWCLEKTIQFMTKTLALIEHAPFGSISKIWLSPLDFILAYAIIISVFVFLVIRNKQWLKVSLVIGLLLSVSISLKAYRSSNTNSLIFFSLRKNSGILFRNGNSAVLLTDLKEQDKAYQYSIQPYLDSCKISDVHSIAMDKDTDGRFITKHANLIGFNDQKILVLDKASEGKKISNKLNIDYIYVTGSPGISLQYLKQNYTFKLLIADGSNSPRLLNELEQGVLSANINLKNLKRNKSLIFVSNH